MCRTPGQATAPEVKMRSLYADLRLLNAVGGHQNRAGKFGELVGLIRPCSAVISGEMLIGFQLGIAVRGQHFAVRVNLNAETLGLFQQRVKIVQIVAGDENGLALARAAA